VHDILIGRPDGGSARSLALDRIVEMPLVSVVIASYGRAQLVARAVRSVLAQTHANVEVVVSDDASPDDTVAVLSTIRDPRLRVNVQPKNVGVWENWTAALRMARGEYVVFLGDDDHLTPNFVGCHLAVFGRHPDIHAVLCPMEERLLEGGLVQRLPSPFPGDAVAGPTEIVRRLLGGKIYVGAGMFRRDFAVRVWEDTRPEGMVADWGLFMRGSLVQGMRAAACDGCTYLKLVHPKQLSSLPVEVTTLLAELCERMGAIAAGAFPAIASELMAHAAAERITLARHHAAGGAMDRCRRELWLSFSILPAQPMVWSQLVQSYLWPARMIRTSRQQRRGLHGA